MQQLENLQQERVKDEDILMSNGELFCCCIVHVLPFVENPKQGRFIEVLLSEGMFVKFEI